MNETSGHDLPTQLKRCHLLITGYLRENSTTHLFPAHLSDVIENFTPLYNPIHFIIFDSNIRRNLIYKYPKPINELEKFCETNEPERGTRFDYFLYINYNVQGEGNHQITWYGDVPSRSRIPNKYIDPWKKIVAEIDSASIDEETSSVPDVYLGPINNETVDIIWKHIPSAKFTYVKRKEIVFTFQHFLGFVKHSGYQIVNELISARTMEICQNTSENVVRLENYECYVKIYFFDLECTHFSLTIGRSSVSFVTNYCGILGYGYGEKGLARLEERVRELIDLFPFLGDLGNMDMKDLDLSVTEKEWGDWELTNEVYDEAIKVLVKMEEEIDEFDVEVWCDLKTRRE